MEDEYRMENLDDNYDGCNCSPPVDAENKIDSSMWMNNFIELHVGHEKMRTSMNSREKNLRALRAQLMNDG